MQSLVVKTSGLEPPTPCMSSKYSNQLSYAFISYRCNYYNRFARVCKESFCLRRKAGEKKMKKYKFKAVNRTFQLLLPFLCAADNFAIVFLLCRLGLGILGRFGLADFL